MIGINIDNQNNKASHKKEQDYRTDCQLANPTEEKQNGRPRDKHLDRPVAWPNRDNGTHATQEPRDRVSW